MRCIMQQAGVTAGTGGWMRFKARVSYTGSQLSGKSITISPETGEMIRVVDKNGIVQFVNPIEIGSNMLTIGVTASQYGHTLMQYTDSYLGIPSASAMSSYLSIVQLGTLEA